MQSNNGWLLNAASNMFTWLFLLALFVMMSRACDNHNPEGFVPHTQEEEYKHG